MSELKTQTEASRKEYALGLNNPTLHEINSGCLQRIANATEEMAKSYTGILSDLNWYKREYSNRGTRINLLEKRLSIQKGLVTRYKNQLKKKI